MSICACNKTSLNRAFHLLGVVVLLIGFWYHNLTMIIAAVIVCLIGHLTQILTKKVDKKIDVVVKKKRR
ncbi:MAG: hypothetical protein ABH840_01325 [Nanoarchaeota archaeon]